MPATPIMSRAGESAPGDCPVCGSELRSGEASGPCLACGHGVWFQWEQDPERLEVALGGVGIVTEQNVMRVLGRLDSALKEGHSGEIVLDFGPVTHLSSTAVAHIVVVNRGVGAAGGSLKLVARRPDLLDIFRITRLDSVLDIESRPESRPAPTPR